MRYRIALILAGLIGAATAAAQVRAPGEFEVASVHPNTPNDRIVTIHIGPGGRFAARGYTLGLLIQRAYGVMDWNISGGPAWIREDRFDVAAKADVPGDLTERQLQPMLQRLLADRFKLAVHKSSQSMPGYALTIARGGAKVQAATIADERPDTFRWNATGLSAQGLRMETFARFVGGKLGLVAVDQTGLRGLYDFKVDWKPNTDQSAGNLPGDDPREALRFAVNSALKNQLGLNLAPKRIAVQVIVVDNAEKASAAEN